MFAKDESHLKIALPVQDPFSCHCSVKERCPVDWSMERETTAYRFANFFATIKCCGFGAKPGGQQTPYGHDQQQNNPTS